MTNLRGEPQPVGRSGARRRRGRLTPEERTYREARRRANAKLSFYTHLVAYLSVLTMLSVVAGVRPALIVAVSWGIGLAIHYFVAIVAPELRGRLIDHEVGRRVQQDVSRERQVIENRHERSLEALSASIAHEIRNPITAAKSLVQQMGEDPVSVENIEYAKVALDELDRVERSISHLLRFARDEDLRSEEFSMSEVLDSALDTFRERLDRSGVELSKEIDTPGVLQGDPEKVRRVLINLVGNALDALDQHGVGRPRLEISAGEDLAGREVWVRVRDNGLGIEAEKLSRIFSPFYTTKDHGTGLGLALSKKVVDAHGGSLEVQSAPGMGSEFLLTLPKRPAHAKGRDE